jgi:hypothetical protein
MTGYGAALQGEVVARQFAGWTIIGNPKRAFSRAAVRCALRMAR